MTSIKRIVITSLGNPGQYRDTYHSIGHIALEALQKSLTHDQPPFTPEKIGSQYTLASVGPRITLWQSPSVMNYSGKWLNRAFTSYVKDNDLQLTDTALIVVHDELEAELGAIKTRAWGQSPRGHNGVKSLHESMRCRNYPWARLAVGTGRPSSRANHAVSEFVLSKVTNRCRSVIEETAPHGIFQAVTALVEGWEQEPAPKLEVPNYPRRKPTVRELLGKRWPRRIPVYRLDYDAKVMDLDRGYGYKKEFSLEPDGTRTDPGRF